MIDVCEKDGDLYYERRNAMDMEFLKEFVSLKDRVQKLEAQCLPLQLIADNHD